MCKGLPFFLQYDILCDFMLLYWYHLRINWWNKTKFMALSTYRIILEQVVYNINILKYNSFLKGFLFLIILYKHRYVNNPLMTSMNYNLRGRICNILIHNLGCSIILTIEDSVLTVPTGWHHRAAGVGWSDRTLRTQSVVSSRSRWTIWSPSQWTENTKQFVARKL